MVIKTINIITSLPDLGFFLIKKLSQTQNIQYVIYQIPQKITLRSRIAKIIDTYSHLYGLFYYKRKLKEFSIIESLFPIHFLKKLCNEKSIDLIITKNINKDRIVSDSLQSTTSVNNFVMGGRIISKRLLNLKNVNWINAHGGILPYYGGLCSEYWAITNKDFKNIGYTIHLINPKLDAGYPLIKGQTRLDGRERIFKLQIRNHFNMVTNYLSFIEQFSGSLLTTNYNSTPILYRCPKYYILRKYRLISNDRV
jgi:folate-dependent phosphoribosylglycinamide formyltransferase PurN